MRLSALIRKILRAMEQNGSPAPVFEFDEAHRYFAVTLPAQAATVVDPTLVAVSEVTDQVAALLRGLGDGPPSSTTEIIERLGLSHRPSFRKAYLHPAMAAGLIEMTRPDRPRSSKQRYRLTPAGRAWRAAHEA